MNASVVVVEAVRGPVSGRIRKLGSVSLEQLCHQSNESLLTVINVVEEKKNMNPADGPKTLCCVVRLCLQRS